MIHKQKAERANYKWFKALNTLSSTPISYTYFHKEHRHAFFSWTLTGLNILGFNSLGEVQTDTEDAINSYCFVREERKSRRKWAEQRGHRQEQLEDDLRDPDQWGLRRLRDLQGFRMLMLLL